MGKKKTTEQKIKELQANVEKQFGLLFMQYVFEFHDLMDDFREEQTGEKYK
jgi:hypothetical protein